MGPVKCLAAHVDRRHSWIVGTDLCANTPASNVFAQYALRVGDPEDAAPWREPAVGAYWDASHVGLSGAERLRGEVEGRFPLSPIGHLTGLRLTAGAVGDVTFSMPATSWLTGSMGLIPGGALAILADSSLAAAIGSALPPNTGLVTSELSLRFLRPVRAGGKLMAHGTLVHAGKSIGLSHVQVIDGDGRLIADGSSMCFIHPIPPLSESKDAEAHEPTSTDDSSPRQDPWQRPVLGEILAQEVWDRMNGLEIFEAQKNGELPYPPIHFLTGARVMDVTPGEVVYGLPAHKWLSSPQRTVQGGVLAMLADAALGCAIATSTPTGTAVAQMDLKVNYLRPVPADGRDIRAHGHIRHVGRTIAVAESEVTNADGKPVVLATGSAMLRDGPADLSMSG
jgi:uncharacterized protein (TIGR00369 family)